MKYWNADTAILDHMAATCRALTATRQPGTLSIQLQTGFRKRFLQIEDRQFDRAYLTTFRPFDC